MEGFRNKSSIGMTLKKIKADYILYIFIGILILWYLIFQYLPMGGLLLAFKDYNPSEGIMGSDFIGLSKEDCIQEGLEFEFIGDGDTVVEQYPSSNTYLQENGKVVLVCLDN